MKKERTDARRETGRDVFWPVLLGFFFGAATATGLLLGWHFSVVSDFADSDLRARAALRAHEETLDELDRAVDELDHTLGEFLYGARGDVEEAEASYRELGRIFGRVDAFVRELIAESQRARERIEQLRGGVDNGT